MLKSKHLVRLMFYLTKMIECINDRNTASIMDIKLKKIGNYTPSHLLYFAVTSWSIIE